ncbi:glycosyltransferase family 1 protein [Sandarakinorhabdus sp.]|uniref:glycosyltransferase family 4 protein n=1 Tax=Sandarakinorhabdus sp. TaxID=1916663 RepID=UPI00286D7E20|nr:glycosyltransferase family 1 protein [Sandarakinorhabdus sp.]
MKILLVSDAWSPQVNGVVRTLTTIVGLLRARSHRVHTITPDQFWSVPMPSYPEIRLALTSRRRVAATITGFAPDAVHIATEGPLGWLARACCMKRGIPFTTSFHTRFPDYVAARTGLDPAPVWRVLRRFHIPATAVMVATPRLAAELASHGLTRCQPWTRGVDLALFRADVAAHPAFADLPRPIALHVGRVAVEKNIEAFLAADWHGSKVVVGDGPALEALQSRFPGAHFLGSLHGDALASTYAGADVLVFPSRTDTFGLVMIEALACGTPVAGYPVAGPLDIIGPQGRGASGTGPPVGAVDDDLGAAMVNALSARRVDCAKAGALFSWDHSCDQFLAALAGAQPVPVPEPLQNPVPQAA